MNKNYRGRDIVTRQWHYGDRVVHPDGTCFILNYSSRGGAPMWNRVIPDTVGQNTGMSDADGLPIFVGDIVQLKRTHYRVDPSVGCVAFCECHQDGTLNIVGGILPASKFRHAECHVVGTLSDEAEPCCGNCRHFHNETSEGDGLCSQCGDTITTCGQTCSRHTPRPTETDTEPTETCSNCDWFTFSHKPGIGYCRWDGSKRLQKEACSFHIPGRPDIHH